MPGQAIVTINENQWSVSLATTYAELTTGLRGVASLPAGTGMLFILPAAQVVSIDTHNMSFPLDIIFISNDTVIDVARNVQPAPVPGYLVTEETPCDMFLEVNAGEATEVEAGDTVSIEQLFSILDNISPVISFAIPLAALGFVSAMVGGMAGLIGGSSPAKQLSSVGGSISPEHHSMWLTTEQRKELEKKYGAVAVRWAEEATRPGDLKGVEVAAEYYYRKVKEVFGLGHLSPELTEEQFRKLREVLGLPADASEVLKTHRETGYIP